MSESLVHAVLAIAAAAIVAAIILLIVPPSRRSHQPCTPLVSVPTCTIRRCTRPYDKSLLTAPSMNCNGAKKKMFIPAFRACSAATTPNTHAAALNMLLHVAAILVQHHVDIPFHLR